MSIRSLIQIFIWACFAVGTLQATNAAQHHVEAGTQLASLWSDKDARFLSPSRVQVVPSAHSFIKPDGGSKRFSSTIPPDTQFCAQLSQLLCVSHTPRSCGLGAYYLERTSHDPRAPPLG
ncbi:hypothetical protein SAMN04488557_2954 [Hyphomicrobium facile]|uniref:Uncharacterized protein n=1 Tax=Hyphomicrobium facile TaxID=51670 RepID=A0A1I7NQX2_9HYPH|nr:hypothetical protein SAMN04488557_2954 [Hyphomicrobium facile]